MNNDLMLIKQVRNHDEKAFETLLNQYRKMIYKIIGGFDLKVGDYVLDEQEIFQEASIAFYRAILSFEEDKGVLFSSYAYAVIMKNLNCNIYRMKNKITYASSLDSFPNAENYIAFSLADSAQEYVRERRFNESLEKFIESLNQKDKQLLNLRRNDYSYKEISEMLGVSTKYVDNHIQIIKRKLHQYLNDLKELEETI